MVGGAGVLRTENSGVDWTKLDVGSTQAMWDCISRFAAAAGSRAKVTITGTVFGLVRGGSYVTFGSKKVASYTSWSSTSIVCKVPASAKYGNVKIKVVTPGGTSVGKTFKVKR